MKRYEKLCDFFSGSSSFFRKNNEEHSLFLMAGFPSSEKEMISRADWFRQEFEKALEMAVKLADGRISGDVLRSGKIVTEFTEMAECQTQRLSGIPIDMDITRAEENLRGGMWENSRNKMRNDFVLQPVYSQLSPVVGVHHPGSKVVPAVCLRIGAERAAAGSGYERSGAFLESDHDGACSVHPGASGSYRMHSHGDR